MAKTLSKRRHVLGIHRPEDDDDDATKARRDPRERMLRHRLEVDDEDNGTNRNNTDKRLLCVSRNDYHIWR